ncbi:hypothetical protein D3C86_1923310 [compost metagenome]
MISETEHIKFQRFRFDHFFVSDIVNKNFGEIGLTRLRTQRGKLSTNKSSPSHFARILIIESL